MLLSPVPDPSALNDLDPSDSTLDSPPCPLMPMHWSGGSVGPSGQCFSSSVVSAGSSDSGDKFLVPVSSPGWPHDALCVLALVAVLGWWRCMPGPLQAPGFTVLGCSHGSALLPLPSCVPLCWLHAACRCTHMPSLVPTFASCLGAVSMLAAPLAPVSGCSHALWGFFFCRTELTPEVNHP